jgi:hypothetical protein
MMKRREGKKRRDSQDGSSTGAAALENVEYSLSAASARNSSHRKSVDWQFSILVEVAYGKLQTGTGEHV